MYSRDRVVYFSPMVSPTQERHTLFKVGKKRGVQEFCLVPWTLFSTVSKANMGMVE